MLPQLKTWRKAPQLIAESRQDLESQLRDCKARNPSIQELRRLLRLELEKNSEEIKKHFLWSACVEHLFQCLDICRHETRETPTEAQKASQERALWCHRIVDASLSYGLDESHALSLLLILAGKNCGRLSLRLRLSKSQVRATSSST